MPFGVTCPSCQALHALPDAAPGQQLAVRCTKCNQTFVAAVPAAPPPPVKPPVPAARPTPTPAAPPAVPPITLKRPKPAPAPPRPVVPPITLKRPTPAPRRPAAPPIRLLRRRPAVQEPDRPRSSLPIIFLIVVLCGGAVAGGTALWLHFFPRKPLEDPDGQVARNTDDPTSAKDSPDKEGDGPPGREKPADQATVPQAGQKPPPADPATPGEVKVPPTQVVVKPSDDKPGDKPAEPTEPTVLALSEAANSMALTPDGQQLAVGTRKGSLLLWDLKQQKQLWAQAGPSDSPVVSMTCVAFSSDAKLLAASLSTGQQQQLRVYDAATGKLQADLSALKAEPGCMAFHPAKPWLAAGASNLGGGLKLLDADAGKVKWSVDKAHYSPVRALAYSPDGKLLVTAGNIQVKGTTKLGWGVKVWDAEDGGLLHEFTDVSQSVNVVAISPNGQWLAAYESNVGLRVWDLATKKEERKVTGFPQGGFTAQGTIAFFPDNKTVAVAAWDRCLHFVDVTTGEKAVAFQRVFGIAVGGVLVTPDGGTVLTHSEDDKVKLWKRSEAGSAPGPKR